MTPLIPRHALHLENILLNVFQVPVCKLLILCSKFKGNCMTHTPPVILACVQHTASLTHTVVLCAAYHRCTHHSVISISFVHEYPVKFNRANLPKVVIV
jgi:hypothetical protein